MSLGLRVSGSGLGFRGHRLRSFCEVGFRSLFSSLGCAGGGGGGGGNRGSYELTLNPKP